jgi:hypothetical protein
MPVAKQARTAAEHTFEKPVPDDAFTAILVAAQQAIKNNPYRMGLDKTEPYYEYFNQLLADVVLKIWDKSSMTPSWLNHLGFLMGDQLNVLLCKVATYGQLREMSLQRATLARGQQRYPFDDAYTSDSFVSLVADLPVPPNVKRINFVAAPKGKFYEPMTLGQQRGASLMIIADLDMGTSYSFDKFGDHIQPTPSYSSRFTVCYDKTNGPSIKFEFGITTSGAFETWDTKFCTDPALLHSFSAESAWPPPPPPTSPPSPPPPPQQDDFEAPVVGTPRYEFTTMNGCACIQPAAAADGSTPQPFQIANFTIEAVLKVIQDEGHMHSPLLLLLVAQRTVHFDNPDCAQNTYYRKASDVGQVVYDSNVGVLHIEVMINLGDLVSTNKLQTYFQKGYAVLLITGRMSVDMFREWIITYKMPKPTYAITFFGTQTNGQYVTANVITGSDGNPMDSTHGNFDLLDHIFNMDSSCPVSAEDHPRLVKIPYAHVRHQMILDLMQQRMPAVFQNNIDFAYLTLGWFLLSLHCKEVWAGKTGLGSIMPICCLYSFQPSTGKSQIAALCHCMMGLKESAKTSGTVTKAGVMELCAMQSNGFVLVDDLIPVKEGHWVETVRCVGEGQRRMVYAKIRKTLCTLMFTTNFLLHTNDLAFRSRLFHLTFDKLDTSVVPQDDDSIYTEWTSCKNNMSAVLPDLLSIQYKGGMDREAIADVGRFLCTAVGGMPRERIIGTFAATLYYTLQMVVLGSLQPAAIRSIIHTCVDSLVSQRSSDVAADQLKSCYVAIDNYMNVIRPGIHGEAGRNLGHHNIRLNQIIINRTTNRREEWVMFRYSQVLGVLRSPQTVAAGRFNIAIREFVREVDKRPNDEVKFEPYPFYDVLLGVWPIQHAGPDGFTMVPMPDYNMPDTVLSSQDAVWVKQDIFDAAIRDAANPDGNAAPVCIDDVMVKGDLYGTQEDEEGKQVPVPYNFVSQCAEGVWRGYRANKECTLAPCSGFGNRLSYRIPSWEACRRNEEHYGKPLHEMFHPSEIEKHFSTLNVDPDSLPSCYTKNPFTYVDAFGPKARDFDYSPKPLPGSEQEEHETAANTDYAGMGHDEFEDEIGQFSEESDDEAPSPCPSLREPCAPRPRPPLGGLSQNVPIRRTPHYMPIHSPSPIFSRSPSYSPSPVSVSSPVPGMSPPGRSMFLPSPPNSPRRPSVLGAGFDILGDYRDNWL